MLSCIHQRGKHTALNTGVQKMIKNSNLNTVFKQSVKTLLEGNFFNGAHVVISQKTNDENVPFNFKVDFKIVRNSKKNAYAVQFNDIDLIDDSNNDETAEFTVYGELRLFQLIFSLLDQSMLDGKATCVIYDRDDDKVCEFNFVWEG